ncbi:ankyrin repeat domain-containing protein 61-like [Embiotoca jacksoni]|uniref:ankyrin repeat domain-containing protein 61-like n=1 Tax=Embiotoca jacksoni TaxID=100190 RepID=UPI00370487DD
MQQAPISCDRKAQTEVNLRCLIMVEEHKGRLNKRSNIIKFYNNEFYDAILDEDLGQIQNMTKKYGSNFLFKIQAGASGDSCWKGFEILPLHLAATYRRVQSMQSLLSAGADTEMRDQLGRTPLHVVITGWPSIPTTCPKSLSKFQTAVVSVCRKAEECLRLLCEHGVNINAEVEEKSHQTALHISVRYRALSAVQILASYDADVNAMDSSGMMPLHMAAGILHNDIIASLIRHGADINMGVQHSGNTPLHLAAVATATKTTKATDDGISCISELLERGADTNIVNKAGMTPFQEACSLGNKELVDLLLKYGANINKLSRAGENCLFLFLNHRSNVKNSSLLVKLLSLTSPLTVYNQNGHLPLTLTLPCFYQQRDQLMKLIQQPRRLQDICKSDIYLKHVRGKREELRKVLPERLYDFIFNQWENTHNISFGTDGEQ